MKRIYTLLLLLVVVWGTSVMSARQISGKILSDTDSTAVAEAICVLKAGDKVITTTASGLDGSFELRTPEKGAMRLEVSKSGYADTEILIDAGNKNLPLGAIFLNLASTLDEAVVTGKTVTDNRGRVIVYPSDADVKASSTSLSLIQKLPLPGLDANPINRSLSVDGGSPMILIDGVPSSLADFNRLQPKDISHIEYSRITPARYADSGCRGLITVTLKKRNDGGQVYTWLRSAVNTAFLDADMRFSYHQGPSQFTLSYDDSWRNYQHAYDNEQSAYIGNDGFRVNLESHDRNPFNYFSNNVNLRYTYSPDTRTLFSATFSTSSFTSGSRYMGDFSDSELGTYDMSAKKSDNTLTPALDLFFRRDFNERNTLEAQMVGTLSSNDYRRTNSYIYPTLPQEDYVSDIDSRRRSLITELIYTHTFSHRTSLSTGVQNQLSHSRNTYLTSDYKPVLTENNNYLYARFGQQAGPVYFAVASGLKFFWLNNAENKRNFVRNMTQAQVSWQIGSRWNLQGYFQYTPSIPSLASLTDYMQQLSPYLYSNGTADLKASQTFSYYLSGSYRLQKFSLSMSAAYYNVNNAVINEISYMGDGKFLSQSINARHFYGSSASIQATLSDIHGFGINTRLNLSYTENVGNGWSHHLTSISASLYLWWNKGPYTISYYRNFPSKQLYGSRVSKNENSDMLAFEFRPNQHWNFGVSWMYMFEKRGTQYPAWNYSPVNPGYKERYIKDNGNMIVLTASYTTDFGSIFRTARRNLNNADNGSAILKQ